MLTFLTDRATDQQISSKNASKYVIRLEIIFLAIEVIGQALGKNWKQSFKFPLVERKRIFKECLLVQFQAQMFQSTTKRVKEKTFRENCRMSLLLYGAIFVIVFTVLMLILWKTGVFD